MEGSDDVYVHKFSMGMGGKTLFSDCKLSLAHGRRYGLIGPNGCGKSTLMTALGTGSNEEIKAGTPPNMDILLVEQEVEASDEISALQMVLSADTKRTELLAESKELEKTLEEGGVKYIKKAKLKALDGGDFKEGTRVEFEGRTCTVLEEIDEDGDLTIQDAFDEDGEIAGRLRDVYDELDDIGADSAETRASTILTGLQFLEEQKDWPTSAFSGGWRMRISLARALFRKPRLLLLDEPTNHLDLEACVWLEEHLASYSKCLLVISHSQDFLNSVCTHTVWLHNKRLAYYGGNYAAFCKVVEEEERVQMREYDKQQADIEKLETFVRVNKANGVASSAKSKKKVLEKVQGDAVERPKLRERTLTFTFPECTRLAPPVLPFDEVCFAYSGKPEDYLYKDLDIGIDCDSRVALVGPNGCGKSTLLKLMSGELSPSEGTIKKHQHCVLGLYHQHSTEVLENDLSPLQFMKKHYPPSVVKRSEEVWRSYLALFGFATRQQTMPIGMMSGGQKSRLVFAMLAMKQNSLLLLDEPTNHLDVDAVDGLAEAIKGFGGGVILVSHDFRLIDQVANEIWVCENKGVRRYNGTIHDYKKELVKKMGAYKV